MSVDLRNTRVPYREAVLDKIAKKSMLSAQQTPLVKRGNSSKGDRLNSSD